MVIALTIFSIKSNEYLHKHQCVYRKYKSIPSIHSPETLTNFTLLNEQPLTFSLLKNYVSTLGKDTFLLLQNQFSFAFSSTLLHIPIHSQNAFAIVTSTSSRLWMKFFNGFFSVFSSSETASFSHSHSLSSSWRKTFRKTTVLFFPYLYTFLNHSSTFYLWKRNVAQMIKIKNY